MTYDFPDEELERLDRYIVYMDQYRVNTASLSDLERNLERVYDSKGDTQDRELIMEVLIGAILARDENNELVRRIEDGLQKPN